MAKYKGYRNRRKFEIEAAKAVDGTYQAIRIFAKSTKVLVIHQTEALKKGYFLLEYENDGQPSGISDERVEFFAFNLDLRDRIVFIRAEFLRVKARRYWRIGEIKVKDKIKYVKMPTDELIRWY
jgi:hypothetical protein